MVESNFLQTLTKRGYIHQCSDIDELDLKLKENTISAYIGFDATGNSLHVGSLLPIMMLRVLQKNGHKPIILMGGGTTKIGDPSGKDETRKLLSDKDIEENIQSIKKVFKNFIKFGDGKTDAIIINNDQWLKKLNYMNFLREYGKHFTINRMLSFDSVKLRLDREQPLTFLEFNYMILQAYDFMSLKKEHNVSLQMGGSDQWGNIINGVELTRRVLNERVYGLTTPLLTTSTGKKMGKTEKGAVWLNEENLSSYDYWQFWRNTNDDDVIKFLKLFTELDIKEIDSLNKLKDNEINKAKKILAYEATKLCRGEKEARQAEETAKNAFELNTLDENLPNIEIDLVKLRKTTILDALIKLSLISSNGEGRRHIKGGAVKINDTKINSHEQLLDPSMLKDKKIKISLGKKKIAIIQVK